MSSESIDVTTNVTTVEVTHSEVNVDVVSQAVGNVEVVSSAAPNIEVTPQTIGNVEVIEVTVGNIEVNPQLVGNVQVDAVGVQGRVGDQGIPGIGKVDSVNGDEGPNVIITKSTVGLSNVDNTSDVNKPISTAQAAALALKAPLASPTFTGTVSGITKAMVGLGSVDNTADTAKPVSTAQQTALNLKANLASPTFTGTVGGITAAMVGLGNVNNLVQVDLVNAQTIGGVKTFTSSPVVPTGSWTIATTSGLQGALDLKAPLASPAFTGSPTIGGTAIVITTDARLSDARTPLAHTLESHSNVLSTAPTAGDGLVYETGSWNHRPLTKVDVGLNNVDNTADTAKPVSTAQQTALNLKANLASPTFTGTVNGITATMVGLGNVVNAAQVELTGDQTIAGIKTFSSAPVVPDNSWTIAKTNGLQAALNLKANLASPTFTGTVSGITKAMVGLSAVDNTSDAAKPVSTATQTALNLKANISSLHAVATSGSYVDLNNKPFIPAVYSDLTGVLPTSALPPLAINEVTPVADEAAMLALPAQRGDMAIRLDGAGTFVLASDSPTTLADWKNIATPAAVTSVAGKIGAVTLVKADVGLSNVDNTSDAAKPVSTATQTALNLKANLASPTFTGTVSGITKAMVGLGSVDNTTDAAKPVSTATQTALNLKANLASPTFTGTVSGITAAMVGASPDTHNHDTVYVALSGNQTIAGTKTFSAAPVVPDASWTIAKTNGLQGALDAKANLASPTFTGTVSGITAAMVGLGSVDNTSDAAKPVSTAQQTALNLKANLASPTFTGTVGGITKAMVGLSAVDNTSDASKPVSTAQQTALNLKANLASPTFTGTVTLPAVTASGIVTFDGNDYVTFGAVGVGPPTFTTRSVGTKIVLYSEMTTTAADYAIGIDGSTLWNSTPTTSGSFKWYGGTTLAATLTSAGALNTAGVITQNGTAVSLSGHIHDDRYYTEAEADSRFINWGEKVGDNELPDRLGIDAYDITDWNLATQNGWYMSSTALNAPAGGWYFGQTISHNQSPGWHMQTVYPFTSGSLQNGSDPGVWRRLRQNGTWGAWYRIEQENIVRLYYTGTAPARPAAARFVEWVGPNAPTGMVAGDTWIATA